MSLLEQVQGLLSRSHHPLLQEEPTTATWVESLREAVFLQARLALQRKQLRPLRRIMELYPEEITSLKSAMMNSNGSPTWRSGAPSGSFSASWAPW